MSKRFWSGLWLTPWLLASSGCTTVPFGHSASKAPLPADRKLAIAQTFERQGHDAQARQIYEQILAADPNSTIAADRLETLIAKSNESANRRLAQAKRNAASQSAAGKAPHVSPTLRDMLVDTAKSQGGVEQVAASKPPALPAPVDSRSADMQPASHLATTKDVEASELKSQTPDSLADTPPSPSPSPATATATVVINETLPAAEALDESEAFWELPERRSSVPENLTHLPSDLDQLDTTESSASGSERLEAPIAQVDLAPQDHRDEGVVLAEAYQHLFGEFKPSMLDEVRERSDELQDVLLSVAADSSADPGRRARAIFLLGQIGPEATRAVKTLNRVMHTALDSSLRMETAEAILLIQPENEDAVRLLLESLKSEDPKVRWYAAFALRLGVSAHPTYANLAVERLLFATAEGDLRLRRMAMLSLGAFGRSANQAVPTLIHALEDSDEMTRVIAAASLKLITEPSEPPPQYASRQTDASTNDK